jgi:hypothetical protein
LRKANEQLERKNQQASKPAAEQLTWEQRKRQLLAQGSTDETDKPAAQEPTSLDDTVRMTDEVILQKDQKIAELMSKLQRLQDAVEEAAREKMEQANADQTMAQTAEQERLRKLQEEWREKLRGAEVEIAVQRAENARRRAELDEKARDIEAQLALAKKQVALSAKKDDSPRTKKRWFNS